MKCNNCGFEHGAQFKYCPNCGTDTSATSPIEDTPQAEYVSLNPAADKVLGALKDKLFLAMCILMSASCVFSIAQDGMPLINILITIFMWLTYTDAQKGFANEKHLQSISGAVYASYIITNVASIILIVCGALTGALFAVLSTTNTEELVSEFKTLLSEYNLEDYGLIFDNFTGKEIVFMFLLLCVGIVLGGVINLIINILGMKKIHRFAKSVYEGIMYQNPNFENAHAVKNWLVFFAVFGFISIVPVVVSLNVFSILGIVSSTATTIIAAILVDKYFIPKNIL